MPVQTPSRPSLRPDPEPAAPGPTLCLHELFDLQARRTPDAVAVVCDGRRLSYGELGRRATRLARRLTALGVGPNTLVGLCVERSVEMVVGILGVLKAGGAYVPLDPDYPRERLALLLEDARVPVLVTQRHLTGRLPRTPTHCNGWAWPATVLIDDLAPSTPGGRGEPRSRPDDLAYVIFTSGSTGRPKGVRVRHANVVQLFAATRDDYRFGADDVWTLFHSFAFDFSVWELWGALLHGGRLVVVPHAVSRAPADFLRLLRDEGATVLNQTPSAFRQLIQAEEAIGGADLPALRLVIFGGEALTLESLGPWWARHGDRHPRLVNMYGITETTVHVTHRPITRGDLGRGSPIGRPIHGWTVHLLGDDGRPVPDGEPGEIHVGGVGVAAGYLNRPELTAERFVPDPFDPRPGTRLYRSGDLARRLPDGDLEYLGRSDQQVKIRGFRVELLEVEAALARHPAVRATAVLAREDTAGDQRLVAYVVPAGGANPSARELRAFLATKLPDHMVPAAYVVLAALPLTAHGKVDRAALPPPPCKRTVEHASFIPPRTERQRRLAALWEELLKVEPIGVRDDFFELGGNSLLAVRLCAEIARRFGQEVSPALLLPGATIERLDALLERPGARGSSVVPIRPHGSRSPFFCVHPLGGQALGYRLLAKYLDADQPFYGLQARELSGGEPFARLEEMAAHYVGEVVQVEPRGPYCLGGYSFGAFIAYEMACQLVSRGRPVALLAMLDDGPSLLVGGPRGQSHHRLQSVGLLAANAPRWLWHRLTRTGPRALWSDGVRKLRVWGRRLTRPAAGPADVEEAMDLSTYGEGYRRTLAIHYQALKDYEPGPYPGRVTLFRARVQPLLGSHRTDLGWGRLAGGGVEVANVPGDHDSLVTEPDVRALARALSTALASAQAHPLQRVGFDRQTRAERGDERTARDQ